MRIAVIHGYFLSDSGSAVYVRELTRELVRQGHEVTLVCQEQAPQKNGFIGEAYDLDPEADEPERVFERSGGVERRRQIAVGGCRLVRPRIGRRLLTYVAGPFPGFEAIPFQDAPDDDIAAYIEANIRSLEKAFELWPPQLVLANHLVVQPYVSHKALEKAFPQPGGRPPYLVTVHGSALNFTVKHDRRMAAYAREGIEGARSIVSLSSSSCEQVVNFAAGEGIVAGNKCHVVPPGVDTALFTPEASGHLSGQTLMFVGRLLWTKGLQYIVAALPLVLARLPQVRLVAVGDGPMRDPLQEFIDMLDAGDLDSAAVLAERSPELRASEEYGPLLPEMDEKNSAAYIAAANGTIAGRVRFLGHLPHGELAPLYASASIVLSPSVFPEAFALVSVEAMAGGAIPLATYQTGLRDPIDEARALLSEEALASLKPGCRLTRQLAEAVVDILDRYPTTDAGFRRKLHGLAETKYSWSAVADRYLDLGLNSY